MQGAKESIYWLSVSGIVMPSSVESHQKNSKNGTTYKAEIFYDYKVNGTKHSSNRVGYGDFSSSNPSCARSVANQYLAGKM